MTAAGLIALVGPDGAGKTALAQQLAALHPERTAYVHFRPRSALVRQPSDQPDTPVAKVADPGPRLLGWVRLLRSVLLFWVGYLRRVRPLTRSGVLVIADRWGFGYVAQPTALRYGGPAWLARLAVRLLPQPEMTVNLVADPELIHGRKSELSTEQITLELEQWARLPVRRLVTVRADRPLPELAREVLRHVEAGRR